MRKRRGGEASRGEEACWQVDRWASKERMEVRGLMIWASMKHGLLTLLVSGVNRRLPACMMAY